MFNKRNTIHKNFFRSEKFYTFVALGILILIVIPLVKNIKKRQQISDEVSQLNDEIAKMENKNEDLRKLISYLESPQFIEEKARLDFGLKKEGEQVAVITLDKKSDVKSDDNKSEEGQAISNPTKWWRYFFK